MTKKRATMPKKKVPAARQDKGSEARLLGVMNVAPADIYSKHPCLIGFGYMRLEVTGDARACCIAKHSIGSLSDGSWREIWRSEAYGAFRRKMLRIHEEKFHLRDPEFLFCQQCSHINTNMMFIKAREENKP